MKHRALQILWPAFLGAGVLELLVFGVVDPSDLTWLGGAAIDWPRQAVYSVAFLLFWAVTANGWRVERRRQRRLTTVPQARPQPPGRARAPDACRKGARCACNQWPRSPLCITLTPPWTPPCY